MDYRNGCCLLGSLRPSSSLERPTLNTTSYAQERTEIHACRHIPQTSHRNRRLGDTRSHLSFSIQWSRVSLLQVVYTFYSIGVSHGDRSELFRLWASSSSCRPLRHVDGSFWRRRLFWAKSPTPHSLKNELSKSTLGITDIIPWVSTNKVFLYNGQSVGSVKKHSRRL